MDNDTDFIATLLDNCGILAAGDELIRSLNRGGDTDAFEQLTIPEIGFEDDIKKVQSILLKYSSSDSEPEFWDELVKRDVYPINLEGLCYYLVSNETYFQEGVTLYSILLITQQCGQIWSSDLFSPILKTLITAQQMLEEGAALNSQTQSQLQLTILIISNLTKAFTEHFSQMIGMDILIALCELIFKLMVGFRVELDKFNNSIANEAVKLAKRISNFFVDSLLPFLVDGLLLNFASSTTTVTTRLEKVKDRLFDLTLSILKPSDDRIVLVCKHLMMRSPDKSHLKKLVATTVFRLTKYSTNAEEIVRFALKLGKATKIGLRCFASYLLQLYLVNISDISPLIGNDVSEMVLEIAYVIQTQLNDQAPTVRASSLDALSAIIENLEMNPYGVSIKAVIDSNGSLERILKVRISEEKLIVRRAALQCLSQIVNTNARNITPIMMELLSSRLRDRSVSIRTFAIKSLSNALDRFPYNELFMKTWLDSVLPLISDPENSVQMETLNTIENHIINPLMVNKECKFLEIMTKSHFDFMRNVFSFCKQKAISLEKISKALTKRVLNPSANDHSITSIWKLVAILSGIEKIHFNASKFYDNWSNYQSMPPEYFTILANLRFKDQDIIIDCLKLITNQTDRNTKDYQLIHSLIKLIGVQENATEALTETISVYCSQFKDFVENGNTDVNLLITKIFAFGEFISISSKVANFDDFDFTGIQLLISNSLPNGTVIPEEVRAISVITLGKLCLAKKDISRNFAAAFANLLSSKTTDYTVKSNCLVVLADLCVAYSALVESYVNLMLNCLADSSSLVRHQALLLLTRLVVEDYLKMTPVLFYRFVYCITDNDAVIANFACSCLFNVIMVKFPSLVKSHFLETIFYFSNESNLKFKDETEEERALFSISDRSNRHYALCMLISKMDNFLAFSMTESICKNILAKFVSGEYSLKDYSVILDDSIFSLIELEKRMDQTSEVETVNEDTTAEKIVEAGKKMIHDIHNSMIESVLPTLNKMHRLLRDKHSPMQSQLKLFYQRIVAKNPDLIKQLEKSEPILAIELKNEMEQQKTYDDEEEDQEEGVTKKTSNVTMTPPRNRILFESHLLSKIASTPRSMLCTPGKNKMIINDDVVNDDDDKEMIYRTPKRNTTRSEFGTPPHDPNL